AREPDALNPDYWAIDAYAFSIPEKRAFMSRLFMNLSTNVPHYPEWKAYLKDRQPRTLIVWGRNDPLILAGGSGSGEADCADGRTALFRRRPLRARRVRRRDHRDVLAIGTNPRDAELADFRESSYLHSSMRCSKKLRSIGLRASESAVAKCSRAS